MEQGIGRFLTFVTYRTTGDSSQGLFCVQDRQNPENTGLFIIQTHAQNALGTGLTHEVKMRSIAFYYGS